MWINQSPCCLLVVAHLYFLNCLVHSQETGADSQNQKLMSGLVPPTPQIHGLIPDFISDTLDLEWYDGGSAFLDEIDATWQIKIMRKDPKKEVARETYHSKLTGLNKLLHWTWTSDLPFNCTTHYVRIRYQFHVNVFYRSKWSRWSKVQNISGLDTGSSTGIYPIDRVVEVGSNVTFCCVWENGQSMKTLNYSSCLSSRCWTTPLSNWSRAIHVQNVSVSPPSGNKAWCIMQNRPPAAATFALTSLFVGYPPDTPQNFSCERQNCVNITCKWDRGKPTKLYGLQKTNYVLFERISGKNITCPGREPDRKHYQCGFPIQNGQTMYNFTVHASNHLGQAKASLLIHINALIPPTPQIHGLTPNFISDTLDLEWYDGALPFSCEINATWQIQILRKDPMEEVALETYHSVITGHKKRLHWTWTSDLPFNCTTHYVRIRCQLHGNEFDGSEWGAWSQLANISGLDTGSSLGMYPIDGVVEVGSNVTFCCVWKNGQTLMSLNFSLCLFRWCWTTSLSKWSMAIHVQNVSVSLPTGDYAWCVTQNEPLTTPSMARTLLFVGYPPDVPQNLKCKKQNSKEIACQWGRGRSTRLFGNLRTSYFLFEEISGEKITCTGKEPDPKHYQCNFPILNGQTTYNFTVHASNHLGQAKASLLKHIKCRGMKCKGPSYNDRDLLNFRTDDSFYSYPQSSDLCS